MDLRSLLSCFSVAMLGIAVWAHLPDTLVSRGLPRSTVLGLLMGASAAASMLVPMQVEPGLIFDLRAPLLATAGLIGGPIAAAVAAVLAIACRIHLAGIGTWPGVTGIALSAMLGATTQALAGQRRLRSLEIGAAALLVTASSLLAVFLLPSSKWQAAFSAAGQTAALTFACTWLFSLSLLRDMRFRMLIHRNRINGAIIDTLPDSLNAKDVQSRFLAANPATVHLMQVASSAELVGKSDADFFPPDMAKGFREEDLEVLNGRTVGPIDQEVRFADGSTRWLTSLKTPLRDARGRVSGIITHNRDVTAERKLAAELSEAQGFLREAMANMADGLVLFARDGSIRFCNEQYRGLFPATQDLRVPGGRLTHILHEAVRRGEESPKQDVEQWIEDRISGLGEARDWLIEMSDGRAIEARTRPIAGSDTLVMYTDVTARRRVEQDLLRRATHDPLTGLANRAEFEFRLRAAHQRAMAGNADFAVVMMDLDRFKRVNDTFGHAVGDRLLVDVACRLRASVRSGDLVARLGGDEFAILVFGRDVAVGAKRFAERAMRSVREPFDADGTALIPGGSFGIAPFSPVADPMTLMVMADQALYAAKRVGGDQYRIAATTLLDRAGTGCEKAPYTSPTIALNEPGLSLVG